MYASQLQSRLIVRMPDDMKAFVAEQAKRNLRSMNSEVQAIIRDRMHAEKTEAIAV